MSPSRAGNIFIMSSLSQEKDFYSWKIYYTISILSLFEQDCGSINCTDLNLNCLTNVEKSKTWKVNERNRRSFFFCKWLEKFTIAFSSSKLKASKRMFNISTYTISVCFIWYMNAHILLGHKTLLTGTLSIKAFLSMLSACALYVVCTRLTQRWVS